MGLLHYCNERRGFGADWKPQQVTGGPLEATEASSRAQMLAQLPKSRPLPTPPGPLKLRLFGKQKNINK